MSDFHGLDCSCCKDKIPQVQEILAEAHRIMGMMGNSESQDVVQSFRDLSLNTFGGEIDDIVQLAELFFNAPIETLDVDQLKLSKEDENKKIGSFNLKDLTDVPGLDVSKILDFSLLNVSQFSKLKFSLSVPTIEVVKKIPLPLISIELKFCINRKGFSFFPVLDFGVKTRKDALDNIKGIVSRQPINAKTDFNKAKNIVNQSYSKSKEVQAALAISTNTIELINNLATLGILILEDVDIEKEIQSFIDNETEQAAVQVYDDPNCGNPGVTPAPFDPNELKEVEKDCCSEDRIDPVTANVSPENPAEFKLDPPALLDDIAMLADLDLFLKDINISNDIIQKCGKEKANAINSYYWFLETSVLNNMIFEYVSTRSKRYDEIQYKLEKLEAEQTRILKAIKDGQDYVDNLRNSATVAGNAAIRDQYAKNKAQLDKDLLAVTQAIAEWNKYTSALTTKYQYIYTAATANNFSSFNDPIKNKFNSIRSAFSIHTNPITDQAGYESDGFDQYFKLRVFPFIIDECKSFFALNSPRSGETRDYHELLTFRNGDLADKIWNAFYSYKRVDTFFTYQEQGYLSPKPQYDDKANPIGASQKIKVKSGTGDVIDQVIAKDAMDLQIDPEVAKVFWPGLEKSMKEKINLFLTEYRLSKIYTDYIDLIKKAAIEDAEFAFTTGKYYTPSTTSTTNNSTSNYGNSNYSVKNFRTYFDMVYNSVSKYQESLDKKVSDLDMFTDEKNRCIAEQEAKIIARSQEYGKKMGTPLSPVPVKDDCYSKLGSDPVGIGRPSECPGISKNCYWAEYTNFIQNVSLMPIPDDVSTGQLTKRFFRYYSVAIQIPIPSPAPVVLPTLASGIPDPMISIPMPLIWKHIISISSPIGLFVVWISICGPIPGPFIMYVDEKVEPCFLVSPKGPISIPAHSLRVPPTDEIALIDFLTPFKELFKVPLPLFTKLIGSDKITSTDPDSPSVFIDKIKEKIKAASDSISTTDPWTVNGETPAKIKELKDKINKSFRNFPPDIEAIKEGLGKLESSLDDTIDKIKIKPITFPKNAKKSLVPMIGPAEFLDDINKMIDSGTKLAEIGLGVPMISLRKKVKILLDRELSSPKVKKAFLKINQDIADLEDKLRISADLETEDSRLEKLKQRADKLKETIKAPLQVVADKITPEMLGFISMITVPIPLPFPCFDNITVEPIPPYILALIAAIKALPSMVDELPTDQLIALFSKFIDLSVPLPRVEDCIYFLIQSLLAAVPDLNFPDPACATVFKQTVMAAVQNFFKLKIRIPHPGMPPIVIPPSLIKNALKTAVKAAFGIITNMIISEIQDALKNGDLIKILAVAAIIKGIFGTDLASISGEDIKSFVLASLKEVDAALDSVKAMIPPVPNLDYMSIKETLFPTLPPKFLKEGPFVEVGTKELLDLVLPLLESLAKSGLPFPAILAGASQLPSRAVLSKLHPFSAKEILPTWEKMSPKNVPFVIWLDQLVATAQKQSGIGSDYVLPYWLPDI